MSTATQPKPQTAKDVVFVAPDQVVVDRKWNGRWNAVQDEISREDVTSLNDLNNSDMVPIRAIADSIKEMGQLEDVLVREEKPDSKGRTLHVVAGQGRTRAFLLLDKEDPSAQYKIRCRILPKSICPDEKAAFLINEEENRKRNNLTLLDKSYCMQRERDDLGYTVADIARRWQCSVPAVTQALRLVDMPTEVQKAVADKVIFASDAIVAMKDLTPESQIEIATIAQDAKKNGTPLRSSQVKELARARVPKPAETTPAATADGGTDPAATATNGATATAPKAKKRGRPASPDKKVPRGLSDLRAVLKDREGAVSSAIVRYLEGFPDMDEQALVNVLNAFEYVDGAPPTPDHLPIEPRTEGEETPAGDAV